MYICEYLVNMTRSLFCVVYLRVLGRYDQISVLCCISESTWWKWPGLCFVLYIWEYLVDVTRSLFCVVYLRVLVGCDQILIFLWFVSHSNVSSKYTTFVAIVKIKKKFIVYKLTFWLSFLRMVYCLWGASLLWINLKF